jgi:hypothetical protein
MRDRSRRLRDVVRLRAETGRDGERGQILVLFTLAVIVILLSASIVVDVGLLRTDSARLQNALDAGALAAAQQMPATTANVSAVSAKATSFTTTNYPGLDDPGVAYACLIGLVPGTGLPRVSDMPAVCNVSFAAASGQWRCTATVCWAPCDPVANVTDVCNTVVLSDSAVQPYGFGRVVGINSGNTGTKVSAACKGPCGFPPIVPVDVVVLLDRTASMDGSGSVANLRNGARTVLTVFDPTLQRVALGFTGPTSLYRTTGGSFGSNASSQPTNSCTSPNTVKTLATDPGVATPGTAPAYAAASSPAAANASGGATTLVVNKPGGTASGDFLVAAFSVSGGTSATVSAVPAGWTLIRRTDNGTNVSVLTYRKFAAGGEPATYTWTFGSSRRASGSILRYTGVDTASPVGASSGQTGSGTTVTAPAITPTVNNSALVGVFGTNTNATFTIAGGTGLTERSDMTNSNAAGPATMAATGGPAGSTSTGTKAATATASATWAAQLVALSPVPGPVDVYGTNTSTDVAQWVPIGFTGTDSDTPTLGTGGTYNEAYASAGNPVAGSHVVQAIGCFDVSGVGTNLARPLLMAQQYLATHGRPGVKQGIILETDGAPNNGGYGPASDYTNAGVLAAATAVKNAGIDLFTIGYGVDNATVQLLAGMATSSAIVPGFNIGNAAQVAAENGDGDHFFVTPTGGDLSAVLRAAASQLVVGTRLVQMYPTPIVSSVAPNVNGSPSGGTPVAISGQYFTDAYSVTFGGANAVSFTVVSDTRINAIVPAGAANSVVDVQVSTPGGSSKIVAGDRFAYGP